MASPSNPLTSTALQLQEQLEAGSLTSVQLTQLCFEQINKHNDSLNAMITVCPEDIVLARATKLDQERQAGHVRGRLHGIPVVVKDAIVTEDGLGMPTTAGSFVFASMTAKKNAPVIEKLLDAGLIIMGKSNMTEFCGLKSRDTPVGWSAYGGQTNSPYRRDDLTEAEQPVAGGSSSGSAVCVASGFSPLAIGTETTGSVVYPASLSGLYAVTLTRGAVSAEGVFKLSSSFDSIGAMARDPYDLALLASTLADDGTAAKSCDVSCFSASGKWDGLSVGITDVLWGIHETAEDKWGDSHVRATWQAAVEKMRSAGANVVHPMKLPAYDVVVHEKQTLHTVAYHEFPVQLAEFAKFFDGSTGIRTLEDVVAWNVEHASEALPEPYATQSELEAALTQTMSEEEHRTAVSELRRLAGRDGLEKAMRESEVDIVVSASDSLAVAFAGAAGWPIATVPVGNLQTNGQPFGFFAVAPSGREDLLFKFMGAFHATFPAIEKPSPSIYG